MRIHLAAALVFLFCPLALNSLSAQTQGARKSWGTLPANAPAALPVALEAGQLQSLLASGEVTLYYRDKVQAGLCPVASLRPAIEQSLRAVKPSIGLECLVMVPLPAKLQARADRDLVLFNLLHGFGTMKGIEYWSQSRNAMHVFFLSSHLVKSPGDRSALPDPVATRLEAEQHFFLEQEDSTFGKCLYDISLKSLGNGALALSMQNIDPVSYGIIPVLGPRAMDMHMVLQPSADGQYLCLYGNAGLKAAQTFGLDAKAQTSYYNRIVALFSWYIKAMAAVPAA